MPNNGTSFIVSIERFKPNLFHQEQHVPITWSLFSPPDYLKLTKVNGKSSGHRSLAGVIAIICGHQKSIF
ncbi:hypothetical protein [Paenibacillus sp. LK1]|uniref:hypothetical protein n=1 Tax=Paenibacillus sp. LK1 TaxID=2053014 RepID=UPI00267FB117|nr:hypothetical protein [Paenibacillus sp. LK1]